jgi:cell division protein FtsI/penicillin-binding protein 2
MNSRPVFHLNMFFLAAFALMALALGYWTQVAREALVSRGDNPRLLIAFDRVHRGRVMDRNGRTLAETTGRPGAYARRYEPASALVVGYASFTYGYSGIEQAANAALSGSTGESPVDQWWRQAILDEPQIGQDVALTLDLDRQRAAFIALRGLAGAVVLVDSRTGDILAMASAPSFDPAQLDSQFNSFTADSNGPLINRPTLGLYQADDLLKLFPASLDVSRTPELPIVVRPAQDRKITPVHLALLIAALDNGGVMPFASLISSPAQPAGHPIAIIPPAEAAQLQNTFLSGFSATAAAGIGDETLGWYAGLRPSDHRVVVVVIEKGAASAAARVAKAVWGP